MYSLVRWFKKSGEEISPWVGLAFGGLYLAAVVGVGIAAFHVQREELNSQHTQDMQQWVHSLAQQLGHMQADGPEVIARAVHHVSREDGVLSCGVVSPAEVFVAYSDPLRVGQPAPEVAWESAQQEQMRIGHPNARPANMVMSARLVGPKRTVDSVWVEFSPIAYTWKQSDLVFWLGYVLLGVLGLYLLAYRLLRRAVQPLAVIRGRLLNCEEQFHDSLVTLRLNDSYDQISTAWNRLIGFVGDMQEQLRRSQLVTNVSAAMDGYRSERLTGILMQIPFGVLVVDGESNISFANRSAAGMLGTPGEPLEGKSTTTLFDESLRMSLLASNSQKAAANTTTRWTDSVFNRPHGEVVLRFWPIPSDGAENENILFVQDITQAKEAERARDQFLYHVTHELRTPLTNIRAYAETLSHGVIEDEQTIRECYNVIMGETQRLNRLVEDILNVSQLEVGTARLDLGQVQLEKLMRSVVQDMQGTADAKNIDLVLHMPAKTPQIRGDKERLAVVLTNLVGNAIKYTPTGGRVDVRCLYESGRVRIAVTDTGIGIKPEDHDKIFEKFYRVNDEQVTAVPGTGLGLAIVKETVRLHGGAVFVESTLGQGSTFTLTLPAIDLEETVDTGKKAAKVAEKV